MDTKEETEAETGVETGRVCPSPIDDPDRDAPASPRLGKELQWVTRQAHSVWLYETLPHLAQDLFDIGKEGHARAAVVAEEQFVAPLEAYFLKHGLSFERDTALFASTTLCRCFGAGPLVDLRAEESGDDEGEDSDDDSEEEDDEDDDDDDEDEDESDDEPEVDANVDVGAVYTLDGGRGKDKNKDKEGRNGTAFSSLFTGLLSSPPAITRARSISGSAYPLTPKAIMVDEKDDEDDNEDDDIPICAACGVDEIQVRPQDALFRVRW